MISPSPPRRVKKEAVPAPYRVVAYDRGVKRGILEALVCAGCEFTVVPWDTPAAEMLAMSPDGVFLSNGPGDPTAVPETYAQVQQLIGHVSVFGICLGHQMISLAAGVQIEKLKFGHRAGNQPVMNLLSGRVEITAQNHGFDPVCSSLGGLAPEMKSTGEVMGIAKSYPEAYAKTQLAIDYQLPTPRDGRVFISVCDRDKRHILNLARILRYLGFEIVSTEGTARVLRGGNVPCEIVGKVGASSGGGRGASILDLIIKGEIAFIINIPYGPGSRGDGYVLRTEAGRCGVTCLTALSAASAYIAELEARQSGDGMEVVALQDLA